MLTGIKNGYLGCFPTQDDFRHDFRLVHHMGFMDITTHSTVYAGQAETSIGNVSRSRCRHTRLDCLMVNVRQWGEIIGIPNMFNHFYIKKHKYETK